MKALTMLKPSKVREVTYVTSKGNFSSFVRKIMNLNLYVLIFRDNSTICFKPEVLLLGVASGVNMIV
ncbi:hypothetical protein [Clostridium acidisoli]|uniref:hypothetical protein n=1 Tax=Clostridium acidisoli TaxID=91624 RepID=UPI00111C6776|nr:hypothetical protein [Clostridium acidisoli]